MEKGFRNAAVTVELWIRSKHGTWWCFLVTPSTLVEIDRDGKRIVTGQAVAYLAGIGAREQAGGIYLVEEPEWLFSCFRSYNLSHPPDLMPSPTPF